MEDVIFEDLKVKLGYPYLYCHQGNCEHVIMFTDLRLMNVDDNPNLNEYPVQVFKHRGKRIRCRVCDVYTAKWVTVNDVLAYEEPCFFCATCFKGLHYSHSGEKICDFQAYPVVGDFDWWFNVRTCSKWKSTQRKGTRSTIGKANSKMYILTCDPWPTKSKTHEPFLLMANILSEAFLCEGIKPRKEQQYVTKVIRFRNRDS